jgi:hypothetical protein
LIKTTFKPGLSLSVLLTISKAQMGRGRFSRKTILQIVYQEDGGLTTYRICMGDKKYNGKYSGY